MPEQTPVRRSRDEWQAIIEAQADSGLSAKQFCHDQGIGYASFLVWRRRLAEEPTGQAPLIDLSPMIETDRGAWHIELDLGEGMTLRLRRG